MFVWKKHIWLVLGSILVANAASLAQAAQEVGSMHVDGYPGEAAIVRVNGRAFVDLQALAQITGSSVVFERDRIVLTLPSTRPQSRSMGSPASGGFSRSFMEAGIEALASMREWASTLVVTIQNGLAPGNAINPYGARAVEKVYLAATAASTDDDRSGMELLRKELSNVQDWSDKLVKARNSMSAANYTMSGSAIQEDPMFQNALRCGQYLAQMFASGSFQDGGACQ